MLFSSDDGVGEGADAFDSNGDGIARSEMTHTSRGAAVDEVPWIKSGERGEMSDETRNGEDHLAGVAVLSKLAIEIGAHTKVLRVFDVGDNPWTKRFIGWLRFSTEPLFVGILIGAVGNIVAAGVAEDVIQGMFFADTAAAAANDGNQFGLVVHGVVEAADGDWRVWTGDGGAGAKEGNRIVRIGAGWIDVLKFVDVGGVIEANGVDVRWVDRCKQGAVVERQGGVGEFNVPAEDVSIDEGGHIVYGINGGVVELLIVVDAGDVHGAFLSFFRATVYGQRAGAKRRCRCLTKSFYFIITLLAWVDHKKMALVRLGKRKKIPLRSSERDDGSKCYASTRPPLVYG